MFNSTGKVNLAKKLPALTRAIAHVLHSSSNKVGLHTSEVYLCFLYISCLRQTGTLGI